MSFHRNNNIYLIIFDELFIDNIKSLVLNVTNYVLQPTNDNISTFVGSPYQ